MDFLKYDINNSDVKVRLEAVKKIKSDIDRGIIICEPIQKDVNNHIHSTYSFSPYSPSYAAVMAKTSGLVTGGIMDHDSVCGALEYVQASEILGIYSTIGVECRVSMKGTNYENKRTNNPDQKGVTYVALHGIPHTKIDVIKEYFKPVIASRYIRNEKMIENINKITKPYDIQISMQKDVIPISMYLEGGTITERHVLFALAKAIIKKVGKEGVSNFLQEKLGIKITDNVAKNLLDLDSIHFEYDLLGVLKSDLVEKIYVDATDECPTVFDIVKLAKSTGAILAYPYLGDVSASVTGDKKAQTFEDAFIDELLFDLKQIGFNAVTYMPSRNSKEQLKKVQELCKKLEFFEISGEDINTTRQKFICYAQRDEMFDHLYMSTFALIGHEKEATKNIKNAFFSDDTIVKYPSLDERIRVYKEKV